MYDDRKTRRDGGKLHHQTTKGGTRYVLLAKPYFSKRACEELHRNCDHGWIMKIDHYEDM